MLPADSFETTPELGALDAAWRLLPLPPEPEMIGCESKMDFHIISIYLSFDVDWVGHFKLAKLVKKFPFSKLFPFEKACLRRDIPVSNLMTEGAEVERGVGLRRLAVTTLLPVDTHT